MAEDKKLARFLASPSEDDDTVKITIHAEDGTEFTVTASSEQVEDMIDTLDLLFAEDEDAEDDSPAHPS
jgi:hypothetical protein